MNFSCFVIGEGALAEACVELLVNRGCSILGVVSPDPELRMLAQKSGVRNFDDTADLDVLLSAIDFDYLFSIVWRKNCQLRSFPGPNG